MMTYTTALSSALATALSTTLSTTLSTATLPVSVAASETSTAAVGQTTAVTGCHSHETDMYVKDYSPS